MAIGLFRRPYPIRRYTPQTLTKGYASAQFTDGITRLNVQPLSPDELLALPVGERTIRRIKTFGADRLTSANEFTGTPGDRIFYTGFWFECKSSVMWDHTMLSHYRSEFVLLPEQAQEPTPITPPLIPPESGATEP